MAQGTTNPRAHQAALFVVLAGVVVLLVASAWLISEICALERDLTSPAARTPATDVHRTPQPAVGTIAGPQASPLPLPAARPSPAICTLPLVQAGPGFQPTLAPGTDEHPPLPTQSAAPTAPEPVQLADLAEPTPTACLAATPSATAPGPQAATIELRVLCRGENCQAVQTLQTIVQWQDSQGAWHDVPNWQGALGYDGRIFWWVEPKDLGTGPFRWLILNPCRCQALVVTEAFHLPARPGETLLTEIRIDG